MIILKIGGSLLAPKHSTSLNILYIEHFFRRRNNISTDKILVHGVGNVGHGFIKQYGLSKETYLPCRTKLHELFHYIDNSTPATRISPEEIPFLQYTPHGNFLIGGDIRTNLTISSGDDQFPDIINHVKSTVGYMVTDVDGVLSTDGHVIPSITKDTLGTLSFWETHNDVTGGMWGKINKLYTHITHPCVVWIVNGNDLNNLEEIIKTGIGHGTKVIIG